MNSVHERCPNSDSKTVLSPKTGQVHSVYPQPSLLAQAVRMCRIVATPKAVSWPLVDRVAGLATVSCSCRKRCAACLAGLVADQVATQQPYLLLPWSQSVYCDTITQPPQPNLLPVTIQSEVYRDMLPSKLHALYCNTPWCPTIQFLSLPSPLSQSQYT